MRQTQNTKQNNTDEESKAASPSLVTADTLNVNDAVAESESKYKRTTRDMKHGDGECGAVAGATPQHPQPAPTTTATPTTTVPDEKLEPVKAEPVVKIEPVVPVVKLEPCTAAGTVVVADETEDDEGADGEYESLRGPSRSQLRYPFVRVKGSAPRHYASFGMRDHAGKHTRDPRTLERGSRVTVTKARMEPLTVTVIGAVRFGVTVYVVVVVDANVSAPFLLPPRAITSVTPPSAPASVDDDAAAAAISMLRCILDRPENAAMMDGLPFERKKKTTPISTPIKRTSKAVTTAKKPRTPKRKSLSGRNVDAKHANNDIDSDDEDDDDDDDGGDKENKQPNRRATPRKPRKKRSRNDDVGAVAVTAQPAPAVAGIDGLVASLQSFRLIAQAFGELKSVIVGI